MSHSRLDAVIQQQLTINAAAYVAGNDVGGILIFTGCVQPDGPSGKLQSVTVTDAANQKAALTLLLFNQLPAGGTYADHGGLVLSAADLAALQAVVNIAAAAYVTVGAKAVAQVANIGAPVQINAGGTPQAITTLWALLMTTGTPTYGSTTALGLALGFEQD